MDSVNGDEDLTRRIHPDLFDVRIIEIILQGTEARQLIIDMAERRFFVLEQGEISDEAALIVFGDDGANELARALNIGAGIHIEISDPFVNLAGDDFGGFHSEPLPDHSIDSVICCLT